MKIIVVVLGVLFTTFNSAHALKVLNFNVMCDLCNKADYADFDERIQYIQEIIKRHSPDLIALQEIRTTAQVKAIFSKFPEYDLDYIDGQLISYPDPLLAFKKDRYKLRKKDSKWLGPSDGFTFGWEFSLPRQYRYLKLLELNSGEELIFMSSHFDNRIQNLIESAKTINRFMRTQDIPVIFAADTNIARDAEEYPLLVANNITNSYDIAAEIKIIKSRELKDREHCYTTKGKNFPMCSVEHVLLNQQAKDWKVNSWILDASEFGKPARFISDHRAVVVTFSLPRPSSN